MKENLVQWTLLNNPAYLSKCLSFPISKKVGQEITTEFGRLDFVLENNKAQQLIVELETNLNSSNKLNYCFNPDYALEKMKGYSKTFEWFQRPVNHALLFLLRAIFNTSLSFTFSK